MTDAKSLLDHLQKTESTPKKPSDHDCPDGGKRFSTKHRCEDEMGSYHAYFGRHLDEGYAAE